MTLKQKNTLKRWLTILAILFVVFMVFYYSRSYDYGEDAYSYQSTEVRMSGLDVILYYFYMYRNLFDDYPWVVKVSYSIILCSVGCIIFCFISMIWEVFKRWRQERRTKRIFDRYYEPLKEVCEDPNDLSTDEIRQRIQYETNRSWSKAEMFIWMRLFLKIRSKLEDNVRDKNIQNALEIVGVTKFIDQELNYGSRSNKLSLMQALIFLRLDVPETSFVNLATDRDPELRRAAGELYILLSKSDPYRFLNDNNRGPLSLWEMMIAHWVIRERLKTDKTVPSLIPLLEMLNNDDVKASLLRGVGYWGSDSDMGTIKDYFDSPHMSLREAAFDCVSIRKYQPAEQEMKDCFYTQPEYLRPSMMNAMLSINSGKSAPFLEDAFDKCVSRSTRRSVLNSLWNYGNAGHEAFYRLKAKAQPDEVLMFQHVEDKLINREIESHDFETD